MKRIEKTKNRVKSELKIIIKTVDSKKKMKYAVKHVGLKQQKKRIFAKQNRFFEILSFFYHRKNYLLNQKIRIFRILDKMIFFH